jgi:hypothetical protein
MRGQSTYVIHYIVDLLEAHTFIVEPSRMTYGAGKVGVHVVSTNFRENGYILHKFSRGGISGPREENTRG